MCRSWCEAIIAVIILVFTFWVTQYSQWIVAIAAIVLLIHAFMCKKCFGSTTMTAKKK